MNLRRDGGRPLVIGHRGAKAVAPENSLAAFEEAVAAGADLVEFDVAPGLVVAHDPRRPGPRLDEILEVLAPAAVGLHLDVKLPGYEQAVLEAIDRRHLRDRVVISTAYAAVSRRVAALAPDLPRAIGYPRDRYGVSRFPWPEGATRGGAAALRSAMPVRIPLLLRLARANVLALHHALCSPAAIRAAHRAGAPVLVWTVNEPAAIERFSALGVDAIVSDDPRRALATLGWP